MKKFFTLVCAVLGISATTLAENETQWTELTDVTVTTSSTEVTPEPEAASGVSLDLPALKQAIIAAYVDDGYVYNEETNKLTKTEKVDVDFTTDNVHAVADYLEASDNNFFTVAEGSNHASYREQSSKAYICLRGGLVFELENASTLTVVVSSTGNDPKYSDFCLVDVNDDAVVATSLEGTIPEDASEDNLLSYKGLTTYVVGDGETAFNNETIVLKVGEYATRSSSYSTTATWEVVAGTYTLNGRTTGSFSSDLRIYDITIEDASIDDTEAGNEGSGNDGGESDDSVQTIFLGGNTSCNEWTGFNAHDVDLVFPCILQNTNAHDGGAMQLVDSEGNTKLTLTDLSVVIYSSDLASAYFEVSYYDEEGVAVSGNTYDYKADDNACTLDFTNAPADAVSAQVELKMGVECGEVTLDQAPLVNSVEGSFEIDNTYWSVNFSAGTFTDKSGTDNSYSVLFYLPQVSLTEKTQIVIDIENASDAIINGGLMCEATDAEEGTHYPSVVIDYADGAGTATVNLSSTDYGETLSCLSFKLNNVTATEGNTITITSATLYLNGVPSSSTDDDTSVDEGTSTAISNVNTEVTEVARYNLMGQKLSGAEKGINIIVYSDGSAKKVLVK